MAYRRDQIGPGFVYAVRSTNPANANEFKVGLSNDAEFRRLALSGTASPFPFAFERVWAVTNMALAEDIAHGVLQDHRMNAGREHFYIVPTHRLEHVFGSLWHEPSEEELDVCLEVLLGLIEDMFTMCQEALDWYEADCDKLLAYSRGRLAWRRRKPGALPPEPLF
ncbi:GIY-YIG nuclease family protein [Burkholderia cepacia]|uniref:GIY-YIG nuclease family protein n=1 Tax=Burkholderia cepacia TaxID=292 RepID=UPI001CF27BB1|nr:GIY-YIG nuclease family protein [Burkholderia cepacia]